MKLCYHGLLVPGLNHCPTHYQKYLESLYFKLSKFPETRYDAYFDGANYRTDLLDVREDYGSEYDQELKDSGYVAAEEFTYYNLAGDTKISCRKRIGYTVSNAIEFRTCKKSQEPFPPEYRCSSTYMQITDLNATEFKGGHRAHNDLDVPSEHHTIIYPYH